MQKRAQLITDLTTNRDGYPEGAMRQSTEIGFPGKLKNHIDITMTPFLKRKDFAGTPESPLYWVERMYQGLLAHQFQTAKDAYAGIMKQAEAKGITEAQREKVLSIMSAIGIGFDKEGKLEEMQKSASKEVAPDDIIAAVVNAAKSHYSNQQKIEAMGKIIAHEKQQIKIDSLKAEAAAYSGITSSIRKYAAMISENAIAKDVTEKYLIAKVIDNREIKANEFPTDIVNKSEVVLACLSAEGRQLRQDGWSHTDIMEHFKCEAQAQPPMPTTDPGADKKWVFDPGQKSWVATQKNPPTYGSKKVAVTPPGMEKTVKELKKNKDVDNPWAVAWWLKNKEKGKSAKKTAAGKFNSLVDAYVYDLSLNGGPDEEVGDAESTGWYGLMKGDLIGDTTGEAYSQLPKEDEDFLSSQAGAIICVDSNGFVYVDYFTDETELMTKWSEIEAGVNKDLEGSEYRKSEGQRHMPKYFEEDVETDPKRHNINEEDFIGKLDVPMSSNIEDELKSEPEREIENYLREHEEEMGNAFESGFDVNANKQLIAEINTQAKAKKISMGEHRALASKIMSRKARNLDELYVELAKIRLLHQD